jgi:hypothetical protein
MLCFGNVVPSARTGVCMRACMHVIYSLILEGSYWMVDGKTGLYLCAVVNLAHRIALV